jgi:hypothetical protein
VAFYVLAQREALGRRRGPLRWVPFLMAVGVGLSVTNARAVLEALGGRITEFSRTPKYNLAPGERASSRRYRAAFTHDTWIELGLAAHFTLAVAAAGIAGLWAAVPFLLLFQAGYGYTALSAVVQALRGTEPARTGA